MSVVQWAENSIEILKKKQNHIIQFKIELIFAIKSIIIIDYNTKRHSQLICAMYKNKW